MKYIVLSFCWFFSGVNLMIFSYQHLWFNLCSGLFSFSAASFLTYTLYQSEQIAKRRNAL
jgi:hypothetical protein